MKRITFRLTRLRDEGKRKKEGTASSASDPWAFSEIRDVSNMRNVCFGVKVSNMFMDLID